MGLLTSIIDKKFDTDQSQAKTKTEAYKAVLTAQDATPDAKEYALGQLLHIGGVKGKEHAAVGQLFGHLLGIKPHPAMAGQTPQTGQAPPADQQPIPGGGPMVDAQQPATPQIPPMPQRAQAGATQPPQRPPRMFMTPEEIGQRKLNIDKPEQDYLQQQQINLENLKEEHQEKLKALDAASKEKIEVSKEAAKLTADQARAGRLTGKEKQDWDTAKALVKQEGGDPNNTEQVQARLDKTLAQRAKYEHDMETERLVKTQIGIGKAIQQLNEHNQGLGRGLGTRQKAASPKQEQVERMAAKNPGMDIAAWSYVANDKVPALGLGTEMGNKKWAIIERGGQLAQSIGLDPADVIAYRANIKVNAAALARLTWVDASMKQFEGTVERNMGTAEKLNDQFERTKYPLANRLISLYRTGTGDPVTNNFNAQMSTIATEYAKVMQGSISASGATVNSAKDAQEIIHGYLAKGQVSELFALLRTDMTNRQASIQQEKDELVSKIKSKPDTGSAAPATAAPAKSASPRPAASDSNDPYGILTEDEKKKFKK